MPTCPRTPARPPRPAGVTPTLSATFAAAATLLLLPGHAAAQEGPGATCARLAAEIDAGNAALAGASAAVRGRLAASLAAQADARREADDRRRAGAVRGLATGILGAVVPGAEMLGALAGAGRAGAGTARPAPPPGGDAAAAFAELAAQGDAARRLGTAFGQFQALGCPAGRAAGR